MRIFVAGASGVIGQHLVPLLVEGGHHVAGMTRTPEKADWLRHVGAEPVLCDVFERDELLRAVARFSPDVVVHQLTDLPDDPGQLREQAAANNRIRREGTTNLVDAARACGARVIAQSVAWTLPGDGGQAVAFLECTALGAGGVVVRYGQLFGPGTYYPVTRPGPPRIHVDEAARRTVTLLEAPSGIVEIVDDPG
ncbi:MAG: NAD-dependent epimerase/dehydratase family protein [Acidimicrobiales bacterium]